MTHFWSYFAVFLSGIIAGLILYIRIKKPDTVINDNQRIGKIKNSGDGSAQQTSLVKEFLDKAVETTNQKKPLLEKIFPGRALRREARRERREQRRAAKRQGPEPE